MHQFRAYDLILASQSPRRKHLLGELGLEFRVPPLDDVPEICPPHIGPAQTALYLAELKADAYQHLLQPNSILITADTIVLLDNQVLGKPAGRNAAIEMLQQLSGRTHRVITGVALRHRRLRQSFEAHTDVVFRDLALDEIEYYVDRFQPFDKAGAYGVQEWIGYVGVKRIEGSYYNVMGLPVQQLYQHLGEFVELLEG